MMQFAMKRSQSGGVMVMMPAGPDDLCVPVVRPSIIAGVILVSAIAGVVGVIVVMMTMPNRVISDIVNDVIDGEQRRAGGDQ